ncbi:MAG: hypothetical protein HZC37_30435 [Burkholderiales bacterium]|nr:hypothetical protein [Burkholderiales bacterium]
MNFRTPIRAALVASCVVLTTLPPAAFAQPDPSLAEVPLPRLQAMVLPCDMKAPAAPAHSAAAAFCAAAADELRRRAFDGSQERLLAWWGQARAAMRAAPAAPQATRPAAPQATRPAASAIQPVSLATPAQLKAAYLHCNLLAETTLLDFGTAARCSLIYEDLKRRVFDGDFQRLLAWSLEQRAAAASASAAMARSSEGAQAAR